VHGATLGQAATPGLSYTGGRPPPGGGGWTGAHDLRPGMPGRGAREEGAGRGEGKIGGAHLGA
jgi:hypothetical protein